MSEEEEEEEEEKEKRRWRKKSQEEDGRANGDGKEELLDAHLLLDGCSDPAIGVKTERERRHFLRLIRTEGTQEGNEIHCSFL